MYLRIDHDAWIFTFWEKYDLIMVELLSESRFTCWDVIRFNMIDEASILHATEIIIMLIKKFIDNYISMT